MALDKLAVINQALLKIGAAKIDTLAGADKKTQVAMEVYDQGRDEMFALPVVWHFATARSKLARRTETPDFGWSYYFNLPAGCIRPVCMVDEAGDTYKYPFDREILILSDGKEYDVIACDQDECRIKYIRRRENPAQWPAWFAKIVILNCACKMQEPIVSDTTQYNMLYSEWSKAVEAAKEANSLEGDQTDGAGHSMDEGNNDVLDASMDGTEDQDEISRAVNASI